MAAYIGAARLRAFVHAITQLRRGRLLAAFVAAVSVAIVAPMLAPGGSTPAWAAPGGSAAGEQAQLDSLNQKADEIAEDYNEAQLSLDQATRQLQQSKARLAAEQTKLDQLVDNYGATAAAAYRNGSTTTVAAVLGSDSPADFLSRATTLQVVTGQQQEQLREVKAARNRMVQQQKQIDQQVAAMQKLENTLQAKKHQMEQLVDQQEKAVSSAQASDRAAAASAARAQASRSADRAVVATYSGSASGRAAVAIRYAMAQLGKPYRLAGDGPGSFDCSGLTMRAWGAAGVHLPHSSRAQYGYGHHVSRSQLRPGDLVFFGSPIHHVGIYLGGGQFIDAPHPGADVRINALSTYPGYRGAVRL